MEIEKFEYTGPQDWFVADLTCPVVPGKSTLQRPIQCRANGNVVALTHDGRVQELKAENQHKLGSPITSRGQWVRVDEPESFNLADWKRDAHVTIQQAAEKAAKDDTIEWMRQRLRDALAIRLGRHDGGADHREWRLRQNAVAFLVAAGEARVLAKDANLTLVALASEWKGYKPEPDSTRTIWVVNSNVGSGVRRVLGWYGDIPVVYRINGGQAYVEAVVEGSWTAPTGGDPWVWIQAQQAEDGELDRHVQRREAVAAMQERLTREIAVRPKDAVEENDLELLLQRGVAVRNGKDYIIKTKGYDQ